MKHYHTVASEILVQGLLMRGRGVVILLALRLDVELDTYWTSVVSNLSGGQVLPDNSHYIRRHHTPD